MDILTHTLSGFAVSTVVASFSKQGVKEKLTVIGAGSLAGALPDLDAISLWSQFDSTIGNLFHLQQPGSEIYHSTFWYSHHGFMHSIVAALLFASCIGLLSFLAKKQLQKDYSVSLRQHLLSKKLVLIGFIGGYLIHLIEDMPTPASVWNGINLLWPSKEYSGGSGDIWWWNNYDIFLIVLGVAIINLLLISVNQLVRFNFKRLPLLVFVLGFTLSTIQIKSRDYNFAYSGNTNKYHEFEQKSKELQKEILGLKLYTIMTNFDNKLSIYF